MSLVKAIKHGKEKRKPYRKSRAFTPSCRNHGACGYCRGNRTYSSTKREKAAQEQIDAWEGEEEVGPPEEVPGDDS